MSSFTCWDVFYVYVSQFKKYKYVIFIAEISNSVGVLPINTDEVENVNLKVCDVAIEPADHPFLSHLSYVSGSGLGQTGALLYLPLNLFSNSKKGVISPTYRSDILDAINNCPSIKQKTLNFINANITL